MAITISGSNAMSGLSGMDTNFDDVLEKLKQVERTKLNRLEAWKSDWQLRYDAFGQVIEQFNAASSMLSTLSNRNNFVTKNVNSTDEGVVTAVANADAQDVQHAIEVLQTASNAVWANTSAFFASKGDVMVTAETEFKLTYAGKEFSVKLGKNTTLDSFASIINNSATNPGVKVNIVKTPQGYTYQIAGKDTGKENDLLISSNKDIIGMDPANGTSTWQSNSFIDLNQPQTDPSKFIYDLTLYDGQKVSIEVTGDMTADQIAQEITKNTGNAVTATYDAGIEQLKITGVRSYDLRKSDDPVYVPGGINFSIKGTTSETDTMQMDPNEPERTLYFLAEMDNGSSRWVIIKNTDSKSKFLAELAKITQDNASGASINFGNDELSVKLSKVVSVKQYDDAGQNRQEINEILSPAHANANAVAFDPNRPTAPIISTSSDYKLIFDPDKLDTYVGSGRADDEFNIIVYSSYGTPWPESDPLPGNTTFRDLQNKLNQDPYHAEQGWVSGIKVIGNADISKGLRVEVDPSTSVEINNPFPGTAGGNKTLENPKDLEYTVVTNDSKKLTYTFESGATMQEVLNGISSGVVGGKLKSITDENGDPATANPIDMTLTEKDGKHQVTFKNIESLTGHGIDGQITQSGNWAIQRSSNAIYTIDNWPVQLESASNQVSDVIEGVVFTIQDKGKARINVTTDIASVEQSIQNFLDAVNSVLITIRELTKVDPDKEVTSNDPNDKGNPNYSMSGLTTEKGGLLTGNYGVQLLKTRLTSLLSSTPPGFKSRTSADDVLSGDALAILANMGIKMNTNETSEMYGLLEIAPDSSIAAIKEMDQANYENMINNQLSAVVDFFCTSGSGTSSSPDFRYGSHIPGITKAGVYDVSYECDANGNISKVMVGGVEAIYDPSQPGNYYSVASGDAKGLSINIDQTSQGTHTGQIRIKEGMVQTVNNFLKAELKYTSVNLPSDPNDSVGVQAALDLKSSNGALMVLRENYRNIMENIDVAIEREQRRLNTWEARQKKIFANLETLLAQYSEQQTSLEGQLKQLNGNSK